MNTSKRKKLPLEFMLDTVILKLKHPNFAVLDGHKFNPFFEANTNPYPSMDAYLGKYVQNPSKKETQYYPRLTIHERAENMQRVYYLYIELSLPKLLFQGENIHEISEDSLDTITGLLSERLKRMDVMILKEVLKTATITRADFGKNIALPHPTTANQAIAEIFRADMGKRKEKTIKEYKNSGKILHFYTTSEGIVFYDKLADIAASRNKSFDKHTTRQEKLLLEKIKKEHPHEILRFEVRFSKQQSLNAMLSKIYEKRVKSVVLKELFNKKLWQAILMAKWQEISEKPINQLAFKLETHPDEILKELIKKTGSGPHSLNNAIIAYGLYSLTKQCGSSFLRDEIEKNWGYKQYKRYLEKTEKASKVLEDIPQSKIADLIYNSLQEFKPYECPGSAT